MEVFDFSDELVRFSESHGARFDGTKSFAHGTRYELVDGQGRQVSVDFYQNGTIYVVDRGVETEFVTALKAEAKRWESSLKPTKSPPTQKTFFVPATAMESVVTCMERTHSGRKVALDRWEGDRWTATFYFQTNKLLVQGKNPEGLIADLDLILQ